MKLAMRGRRILAAAAVFLLSFVLLPAGLLLARPAALQAPPRFAGPSRGPAEPGAIILVLAPFSSVMLTMDGRPKAISDSNPSEFNWLRNDYLGKFNGLHS